MDLGIAGKKALITGSTAGIGLAIAKGLAKEGVHVVVNGRTSERVNKAIAEIRGAVPQAKVDGVVANVGGAPGVGAVTTRVPEVDILVNNAGIFEPKPFSDIPDDDWRRFFEMNVMSGVRFSRFYLPKMLKKNWGRIVFISSESGLQIPAEMVQYGVTKTAQLALSRGLAESVAGTGITVNSVLPGPTSSEGVTLFVDRLAQAQRKGAKEVETEFFKTMRPSSLIKRFATTDEVAAMAVYICSTLASATTGAALRVDGGVVRSIA